LHLQDKYVLIMKNFVAYCLLALFIFSCSPENDDIQNVSYEILPVESAILPDEFHLGDSYQITLTYIRPSTCYAFNNIYYLQEANERTVAIVAAKVSSNNCETLNEETAITFNFKASQSGTYIFKFWQGGDDYEVVHVPVVD